MGMNKIVTVYIVHHVDTEGPLYEPLSELFKRIEETCRIKLHMEPTKKNLERILHGSINTIEKNILSEIRNICQPHLLNMKSNWSEIDEMLFTILSKEYRNIFLDSYGGGWIYNWHIMDHVGFATNERRRDLGYLNIFNHYEDILKQTGSDEDEIHWHFHPVSFFREAHIGATSYENSYNELHQILCRRLIEKNWFPIVNRAGFHSIRPDSNWFLEQWIPFDPSNQSINDNNTKQTDEKFGRYGDWQGAPDNWSLYHPDLYDWRKEGSLNRVVARALNLKTRFRNINEYEIEKAFLKAQKGDNVYLGVINHDFREMSVEIDEFREMLLLVSEKLPDIPFKFSPSVDAFRNVLGYSSEEVEKNKVEFDSSMHDNILKVIITNGLPFGPQPYLAFKSKTGQYYHDNFDFGVFKKEYFYTFDRNTIELNKIDKIAVASNDKYGNQQITKLNCNKDY
jgi:hypothetical protein